LTPDVAYAETKAAIRRKKRETGLEAALIQEITSAFRRDWESFIRVEVNDELNEYIGPPLQPE
jgi:hypothetical protein